MSRLRYWLPCVGLLACDSTGESGAGGAAPDGASGPSSSGTIVSSTSATGSSGCPPGINPLGLPEGWVEYNDWSCECRFYLPASKEVLPPPIEWQPCVDAPNGIVCARVVRNWFGEDHLVGFDTLNNPFDVDVSGKALLFLFRWVEK